MQNSSLSPHLNHMAIDLPLAPSGLGLVMGGLLLIVLNTALALEGSLSPTSTFVSITFVNPSSNGTIRMGYLFSISILADSVLLLHMLWMGKLRSRNVSQLKNWQI